MNKINQKALSVALSALTLTSVLPMNSSYARVANIATKKSSKKKQMWQNLKSVIENGVPVAAVLGVGIMILSGDATSKTSEGSGLENAGHTCFYNSLLQQLYSIKSFRKFVDDYDCGNLKFEYLNDEAIPAGDILRYKMCAFKWLFAKMKNFGGEVVSKADMTKFVNITIVKNGYPPGTQQDTNEAYIRYLADVKDAYKAYLERKENRKLSETNIFSAPLQFNGDTKVDDLFYGYEASAEETSSKGSKFRKNVESSKENIIRAVKSYWDSTKRDRISGIDFDLSQVGYVDPINDHNELNSDFLSLLNDDLNIFSWAYGVNYDVSEHAYIKSVYDRISELSKKLEDGAASNYEKYELYVCCALYYNFKYEELNKRVRRLSGYKVDTPGILSDEMVAYSSQANKFCHKARIFAMLSKAVEGGADFSDELKRALPSDWKSKLDDLKQGLTNHLYGEDKSEHLKNLYPEPSKLKIDVRDNQFSFFVGRFIDQYNKKKDKIDLGDGTLDYYGKNYVLTGVTIHEGDNLSSGGHYYTIKRKSADSPWYEYSDSSVKEVKWDEIKEFVQRNCTMLTYTEV